MNKTTKKIIFITIILIIYTQLITTQNTTNHYDAQHYLEIAKNPEKINIWKYPNDANLLIILIIPFIWLGINPLVLNLTIIIIFFYTLLKITDWQKKSYIPLLVWFIITQDFIWHTFSINKETLLATTNLLFTYYLLTNQKTNAIIATLLTLANRQTGAIQATLYTLKYHTKKAILITIGIIATQAHHAQRLGLLIALQGQQIWTSLILQMPILPAWLAAETIIALKNKKITTYTILSLAMTASFVLMTTKYLAGAEFTNRYLIEWTGTALISLNRLIPSGNTHKHDTDKPPQKKHNYQEAQQAKAKHTKNDQKNAYHQAQQNQQNNHHNKKHHDNQANAPQTPSNPSHAPTPKLAPQQHSETQYP